MEMSEHLFRHESGRLVAALTRIFGVHNLPLAEDVVQDAFCRALEVWKVKGIPQNPAAWLMAVAKHRALDIVRRDKTARTFAPDVSRMLQSEWTLVPAIEDAFAMSTIRDEQLRMMFSCCDPRLAEEVQVALVLNILCGFGAAEIASAFLTSRAAVEKRISRGKKILAQSKHLFDLADAEFGSRLSAVRRALYLLFNEGYHGSSGTPVQQELCGESMRLTMLLVDSPAAEPETDALAALMYLQAARLPTRLNASGELIPLLEQERSRWDEQLVQRGLCLLEQSSTGDSVSAYHVEAAIAAAHATARSAQETDWNAIVGLYERLMTIAPSPVVELNRAIAIGQRDGPERGLEALRSIAEASRLKSYPFYSAAIGELEFRCGNVEAARCYFSAAAALARNPVERRFLESRVRAVALCDS
jgi:RNA polymerase sigma-70 factor (ECF subfamily)